MSEKPHRGKITDWWRAEIDLELHRKHFPGEDLGPGYYIRGTFVGHPIFGWSPNSYTSWIVKHDEVTGEVETRNSRYTLVGPERGVATVKERDGKLALAEIQTAFRMHAQHNELCPTCAGIARDPRTDAPCEPCRGSGWVKKKGG